MCIRDSAKKVEKDGVNKIYFKGNLLKIGNTEKVKLGFQYREFAGFVEELYSDKWKETQTITVIEEGEFGLISDIKKEGKTYQFRAFVEHPKLRVYGDIKRVIF